MIHHFLLFGLGLFILAGCAGTGSYDYKVNTKPYTVNGTTYYPKATADGFVETGAASWYGPVAKRIINMLILRRTKHYRLAPRLR